MENKEITLKEYKEIRNKRKTSKQYKKNDFGNILVQNSYKGPWMDSSDETEDNSFKIISKQNKEPGNETVKKYGRRIKGYLCDSTNNNFKLPKSIKWKTKFHKDEITKVQILNYYDLILSSGKDGRIIFSNNNIVQMYFGHSMSVTSFTLNYDESKIYSASLDGYIKMWDNKMGKCFGFVNCDQPLYDICLDEQVLYGAGAKGIVLADLRTKTSVQWVYSNNIKSISKGKNTVSIVDQEGMIQFISEENGKQYHSEKDNFISVKYCDDNDSFYTDNNKRILSWDKGRVINYYDKPENSSCNFGILKNCNEIFYCSGKSTIYFSKRLKPFTRLEDDVICADANLQDHGTISLATKNHEIITFH